MKDLLPTSGFAVSTSHSLSSQESFRIMLERLAYQPNISALIQSQYLHYYLNFQYKTPIDTLTFDFIVIPRNSSQYDLTKPPPDGCYINGLYLDGAKWDDQKLYINDQDPKVLYCLMPSFWLVPKEQKAMDEDTQIVTKIYSQYTHNFNAKTPFLLLRGTIVLCTRLQPGEVHYQPLGILPILY